MSLAVAANVISAVELDLAVVLPSVVDFTTRIHFRLDSSCVKASSRDA